MLYARDLFTVMKMERTIRPPQVVRSEHYAANVACRYAAVKTLKYPPIANKAAVGARTRDALIEAMRLDTEGVVRSVSVVQLEHYVDLVKTDRAKSYAWWYALIIDPVVTTPFGHDCSGKYVDEIERCDQASLEQYLELSSRYFTHAEVDRCMTELRVAHAYLNAL